MCTRGAVALLIVFRLETEHRSWAIAYKPGPHIPASTPDSDQSGPWPHGHSTATISQKNSLSQPKVLVVQLKLPWLEVARLANGSTVDLERRSRAQGEASFKNSTSEQ